MVFRWKYFRTSSSSASSASSASSSSSSTSSSLLKHVSVEPSYFLYFLGDTLLEFANTNLYLQKACRVGAAVQPDLRTPCDDAESGIKLVADVNAYLHSAQMFAVVALVALYASWSDVAGRQRKFFVVAPMLGHAAEAVVGAAHSYAWTVDPWLAAITSAALQIAFGHYIVVYTFASMYLADVVEPRNRTMRLGILTALRTAALLLAKSVCGFLLLAVGFVAYYGVCAAILSLAAVLGYAFVDDISTAAAAAGGDDAATAAAASIRSVFDVGRLLRSCKIILGAGTVRRRISVTTLLLVFSVLIFVYEGEYTVIYLYLRHRYEWNEMKYSLFLFYGCIGSILGSLFASLILSKLFKMHDALIGVMTTLWDAAIAISYVFVVEDWQLFLISGSDIFFGVSTTVCMSLLTKFYDTSEMGHLFAVKWLFSIFVPICHPTYNILFKSTMHTMPYAFFCISAGIYLLAAILYSVTYPLTRKISGKDGVD